MGFKIDKKREGGPEHEYWIHRIGQFLRDRAYKMEIEKPIGEGKIIDIFEIRNNKTIAIELV